MLVRVITNKDSTEMYRQMYGRVFYALNRVNPQCLQIKHLHSNLQGGFIGLTMDQDTKSFTGELIHHGLIHVWTTINRRFV